MIDNALKNSTLNSINDQLKSVNIILNNINTDIKKSVEKFKDLLRENDNKITNIIKGSLDINLNNINKDGITLFNSQTNFNVDVYLDNKKINVVKDI